MANEVVEIVPKAEADDVPGAASESVWGAAFRNDSSRTVWWQFEGPGAVVGISRSSSGSSAMLPFRGG